MAWMEMDIHPWVVHGYVLLILPLFFLLEPLQVLVRAQSGFLSIDCGKGRDGGYSSGGITYVSDFDFVDAGEIHKVSADSMRLYAGYYPHAFDLRSFPSGTRNCYSVEPLERGQKYLIRASFFYGNYDGLNRPPQFDLYLGVNIWASVAVTNETTSREIIAVASSDRAAAVCLVNTGSGTPFISALELRPVSDGLYPEVNASQSLVNRLRINDGATAIVRYEDDALDRIWEPSILDWKPLTTSSRINTSNGYNDPPSSVMQALVYASDGTSINFTWNFAADTSQPSPRYHVVLHFAELQQLRPNESRSFDIYLNGKRWSDGAVTPKYLTTTTVRSSEHAESYDSLEFSILKARGSTLPPIVNAEELYLVVNATGMETAVQDADAIMNIKKSLNIRLNWMGDPCAPNAFMWDGVNCTYGNATSFRIITMNLSSSGLNGELPTSIGSLTLLQTLDLSNNSLTGSIPDFLATLPRLAVLDLSGNRFTGSIPNSLKHRSETGSLRLNVRDNPNLCTSTQCNNHHTRKINKLLIIIAAPVGSVAILVAIIIIAFFWRPRRRHQSSAMIFQGEKKTISPKDKANLIVPLALEGKQFTLTQLAKITSDFMKEIGRGGFGPVYYGVLENGVPVAIKMLSHSSSQGAKEFQNEAQLLAKIHHKNLVSFVGYCNEADNLSLVYEYMAEGNLGSHLSGKAGGRVLPWKARLRIAMEAAQGLDYLHNGCKPAIVHRDVKSSNILLTSGMEAKIADFGLSKIFGSDSLTHVSTKCIGTPGYVDPEYYAASKLTEKSDVYSFGIVLLELITGLPAVIREAEDYNVHITQWVNQRLQRGEISEIVDKRLQGGYSVNSAWNTAETALACAAPSSTRRPSMKELLPLLSDCMELEVTCEKAQQSSSRPELDNSGTSAVDEVPGSGADDQDLVTELSPR